MLGLKLNQVSKRSPWYQYAELYYETSLVEYHISVMNHRYETTWYETLFTK